MEDERVDPHQDLLTNQQLRHTRDQRRRQPGACGQRVGVRRRQAGASRSRSPSADCAAVSSAVSVTPRPSSARRSRPRIRPSAASRSRTAVATSGCARAEHAFAHLFARHARRTTAARRDALQARRVTASASAARQLRRQQPIADPPARRHAPAAGRAPVAPPRTARPPRAASSFTVTPPAAGVFDEDPQGLVFASSPESNGATSRAADLAWPRPAHPTRGGAGSSTRPPAIVTDGE